MSISDIITLIGIIISLVYATIVDTRSRKSTDAMNEISIANRISDTLRELRIYKEKIMSYDSQNGVKMEDLKLLYEEAYEDYISAYNEACQYYLDGKIDKDRFVKRYFRDIQRFVEDDSFYKQYKHNFSAIQKFYDENKQTD